MLNDSYPKALREKLRQEISSHSKKIHENFSQNFMPFGGQNLSHFKELADKWEELFDGHEVLPELFKDVAADKESWLERARYLVPISGRQFIRLKDEKKIDFCEDLMCHVVRAPYTDVGLEI